MRPLNRPTMPAVCGDLGGVSRCSIPSAVQGLSNSYFPFCASLRRPNRRSVTSFPLSMAPLLGNGTGYFRRKCSKKVRQILHIDVDVSGLIGLELAVLGGLLRIEFPQGCPHNGDANSDLALSVRHSVSETPELQPADHRVTTSNVLRSATASCAGASAVYNQCAV